MVFRHQIASGSCALAVLACLLIPGNRLIAKTRECAIHDGPCTVTTGNRSVILNIEPKPVRAMKELLFSVTITPGDNLPATLQLDLTMPGMQMGQNQITLHKKSDGIYEGKGIIVRCMSGRTLWQVTFLSREMNNPSFTFNVRE